MCYNRPVQARSNEQELQQTLVRPVRLEGIGVHSGVTCELELAPAEVDFGVVFQRLDLPGKPVIPALADYVGDTRRGTTLQYEGASVATVEHLLAALAQTDVTNCRVTLTGPEVPLLDGSALPFVEAIRRAGVRHQQAPVATFAPKTAVRLEQGEAWVEARPAEQARFSYTFEAPEAWLGRQEVEFTPGKDDFAAGVAPARTFGWEKEAKALLEAGLARGATLENVLVIGETGFVNAPRFPAEPALHKLLDLMGDMALVGVRLQAEILAYKSGHTLNTQLAARLRALWRREESNDGKA